MSLARLLAARAACFILKVEESFLVAGTGEEMVEVSIDKASVFFMPRSNLFADIFESFKVGLGIAIAEFMVSDDFNPSLEEFGEIGEVHNFWILDDYLPGSYQYSPASGSWPVMARLRKSCSRRTCQSPC